MPWVPREVYDEMVAALRWQRERVSTPPAAASVARDVGAPRVVVAEPAEPVEMPSVIADACRHYAFGDKAQEAANWAYAVEALRVGRKTDTLLREIRMGGAVPVEIGG